MTGNALILREVLAGKSPGPKEDLVVLNAGAGLYLAGKADSIRDGVLLAQKVVRSGAALAKLEDFRKLTRSLGS